MKKYTTKSPEETESIGFRLAQTLRGGEVIAFRGGLGMGKPALRGDWRAGSALRARSRPLPLRL